jgi:hypothetical protein
MTPEFDLSHSPKVRSANQQRRPAFKSLCLDAIRPFFAWIRQLCPGHRDQAYLAVLAMGSFLTSATLTAADNVPKPILTVPRLPVQAYLAEAQVTSDGRHCVVITSNGTAIDNPSLLRVFELSTGKTTTERAFNRDLVSGGHPDGYRSITPDGRAYCWLDQDRWIVVTSVHSGQMIHRADLTELGVTLRSAVTSDIWISDDGSFLIGPNMDKAAQHISLVRLDFTPSPRVAASWATSGDRRLSFASGGACIIGDRESGRIIGLFQKKKGLGLAVLDMEFQRLSQAPVTVPPLSTSTDGARAKRP